MPGSWRADHDRIPPALAAALYARTRELAAKDRSPVSIARQLSASSALSLSPGTIRHWIVGDRKLQRRNVFEPKPSPALSYIIGAEKGDGCSMAKSGIVKLEVTDRDFAQAFNANMAALFSRAIPNKILVRRRVNRLPMYIVKYSSRQLVRLLRLPLKKLLGLARVFSRDFLRGFFDAEGHVDVGITEGLKLRVGAENSDKVLLLWVKRLLEKHKIASRIERKRKKGTVKKIRGKAFVMKRTSYSTMIGRLADVKTFASEIGFSIIRKTQKLQDALLLIETCEPRSRPVMWKRLYSKIGGEWARIEPATLI